VPKLKKRRKETTPPKTKKLGRKKSNKAIEPQELGRNKSNKAIKSKGKVTKPEVQASEPMFKFKALEDSEIFCMVEYKGVFGKDTIFWILDKVHGMCWCAMFDGDIDRAYESFDELVYKYGRTEMDFFKAYNYIQDSRGRNKDNPEYNKERLKAVEVAFKKFVKPDRVPKDFTPPKPEKKSRKKLKKPVPTIKETKPKKKIMSRKKPAEKVSSIKETKPKRKLKKRK
jgi:hypothetical protein